LEALVFDCDGVILESEDLHRRAYNAAFHHFNVCCPQSPEPLVWTSEFYDELQNQIGGGKPKMRWYFNKNGWPTSTISSKPPVGEQDQATVIDTIQVQKLLNSSLCQGNFCIFFLCLSGGGNDNYSPWH
jgi:hypothetical protein